MGFDDIVFSIGGGRMRLAKWAGCILAGGLSGCSLYPIPDDVAPPSFPTETIVRHARCEMRSAILDYLLFLVWPDAPHDPRADADRPRKVKWLVDRVAKLKGEKKVASGLDEELLKVAKVATVFSFEFLITEQNKTGADAGFKLPWLTNNVVDVGATAALDLTRQGSRAFGTEFKWESLILNEKKICDHHVQQPGKFIYPLIGSIGVDRVVKTFLNIDSQGGAKDNFVDTLTFTTLASAGADATVKLEPVTNQFRLVSGTLGASASRLDIHKLTISLAFPRPDNPNPNTGVTRVDGDLNAPFTRPADWRARYNLCVADARARENSFRILRLEAPEVYCIKYADAFAPQTGLQAERGQNVLRIELEGAAPKSSAVPPGQGRSGNIPPSRGDATSPKPRSDAEEGFVAPVPAPPRSSVPSRYQPQLVRPNM